MIQHPIQELKGALDIVCHFFAGITKRASSYF
jgi:hypothetical protein